MTTWQRDPTLTQTDRQMLEKLDALYGARPEPAPPPAPSRQIARRGPRVLALRTVVLVGAAAWLLFATTEGRAMSEHLIAYALQLLGTR